MILNPSFLFIDHIVIASPTRRYYIENIVRVIVRVSVTVGGVKLQVPSVLNENGSPTVLSRHVVAEDVVPDDGLRRRGRQWFQGGRSDENRPARRGCVVLEGVPHNGWGNQQAIDVDSATGDYACVV